MSEIEQALNRLFERHRIVVWTDVKHEMEAEYDELWLPGVEKITVAGDEFGIKYRVLREKPGAKFLLYRAGPPPDDLDNWLLDVELAAGTFRADQAALWLLELGLGQEFMPLITEHESFFKAASRRAGLKSLLAPGDSANRIRLKMTAIAADAEPRLDAVVEQLLAELAAGAGERIRLIERCSLDKFLWQQVERAYGYASEMRGIHDFALALFDSGHRIGVGEAGTLNNDAYVFLKRWKDNIHHREAFAVLAKEYAPILDIADDVARRNVQALAGADLFPEVDRQILADLISAVTRRTIAVDQVVDLIRRRRSGTWFARFASPYEAVEAGARFLDMRDRLDLTMTSLADGLSRYTGTWYELDQHYRHFVYHLLRSGETTALGELATRVENHYSNSYLLPLNDTWQAFVDAAHTWEAQSVIRQDEFFERIVRPYNKVVVIISDALRFEIAKELQRLISQEDRYDAEIEPLLAMLPSFTQLGMAALLPHETLAFSADGKSILVDGASSQGTPNRAAILAGAVRGGGTAVQAKDLLAMDRDESRALIRDHAVVYVYHNRIDATGDSRDTEERVFDEAEATLEELLKVIKKLANANVNNMLLTADHGFIYQNKPLDESDFAADPVSRDDALIYNRRYVLGRGLSPTPSVRRFTASQVGLSGEIDILIPKSINRLRVQGAGSRYVHGGAALQEVVVPVIRINKKRQSDVGKVDVDILRSTTTTITTSQQTVTLYQVQPISEKVHSRVLRAGLFTEDNKLISDQQTVTFNLADDDPRRREIRVTLRLTSAADDANGQDIVLKLEEQVADTARHTEYKSARYTLRRTFTSDFDF